MSSEVISLPSDIGNVIRQKYIELHLQSPEHKALMAQIRLFKKYYRFWNIPVRLPKLSMLCDKTYDEIFSKPYWFCILMITNFYCMPIHQNEFERYLETEYPYKLKYRLMNDGVLKKTSYTLNKNYSKIIYSNCANDLYKFPEYSSDF
jgi:hypothetical protein